MPIISSTILGLEIPDAGPVFTAALVVHILAGLTCVVTGAIAMLTRKRAGHHPLFGTMYYWGLGVLVASASIMTIIRFEANWRIFLVGTVAFTAGIVGYLARRRRWRGWLSFHIAGMGLSYIAMLTAFYIDNGPQLPLWNRLPAIAFWVGPSLIGVPLIVLALARYRPRARADRGAGPPYRGTNHAASAPPILEDYR